MLLKLSKITLVSIMLLTVSMVLLACGSSKSEDNINSPTVHELFYKAKRNFKANTLVVKINAKGSYQPEDGHPVQKLDYRSLVKTNMSKKSPAMIFSTDDSSYGYNARGEYPIFLSKNGMIIKVPKKMLNEGQIFPELQKFKSLSNNKSLQKKSNQFNNKAIKIIIDQVQETAKISAGNTIDNAKTWKLDYSMKDFDVEKDIVKIYNLFKSLMKKTVQNNPQIMPYSQYETKELSEADKKTIEAYFRTMDLSFFFYQDSGQLARIEFNIDSDKLNLTPEEKELIKYNISLGSAKIRIVVEFSYLGTSLEVEPPKGSVNISSPEGEKAIKNLDGYLGILLNSL